MFNIDQYLKRFTLHVSDGSEKKEKIIAIFNEVVGVTLDKSNIEIKEGVLIIKSGPIIKSEISIKKALLLEKLLPLKIFSIK